MSDELEKLFSPSRLRSKWEDTIEAPQAVKKEEEKVAEPEVEVNQFDLWRSCLKSLNEDFPKVQLPEQIEQLNHDFERLSEKNSITAEERAVLCEKLTAFEGLVGSWILANRIA